ncbi:MAG: pyridoxine 5'-phosphate synthase [Bacteroidetes bacterium HGW-Bacteroidetes-1]|jgi:pyridoxine 5-phosphate synthase|nr:MAG: pyridoxine 5'-phosphate synthase [Bacteroidetes bacterium HGW-Bacteroidetes-1]
MTHLSVNINKVATLRNARGGNIPDVQLFAVDCERFGAEGITVHPRPDQRHITYRDVELLRPLVKTELNIEGYPTEEFIKLVISNRADQVTLVPDEPGQLTSDHGWNTIQHKDFLKKIIRRFHEAGIRTSIFVDAEPEMIKHALDTGTERVELYTESYARDYEKNRAKAIEPFMRAAEVAFRVGIGLNAGHDLNLNNLQFFKMNIAGLLEVSIGHALISEALYYGIENVIQMYRRQLM